MLSQVHDNQPRHRKFELINLNARSRRQEQRRGTLDYFTKTLDVVELDHLNIIK